MRDMRRRCGSPPLLQPFISRVPGSSTQLLRLLSAFSGVHPPGRRGSPSRVLPLSILGSWFKVASSGHRDPIMGCGWSLLCPATHCRGPSPDLRLTAGLHHRTCTVPLLSTVSADQNLQINILILYGILPPGHLPSTGFCSPPRRSSASHGGCSLLPAQQLREFSTPSLTGSSFHPATCF